MSSDNVEDKNIVQLKVAILVAFCIIRLASNYWLAFFSGRFTMGGAGRSGVDMMIQDISKDASDQNYSIIELNFNPAIHIHCYPFRGKNRKAADKIIDLLFGKID